ncbi:KilA-N domain-containing protein [Senegalimassilia anaerobia]|uniref:KilA-N domain-containing protein n=1 Tax=Senegalimassilia anaerobia TaxID=1473216 RepID=UPI00248F4069|nr:KilA-N domain-containing protein [Senegalimassilia anaerobia]
MGDEANEKINALGVQIGVSSTGTRDDYISLTDIARYKSDEPKMVIQNWMRNRNTIEFLGVWEGLHNHDFKGIEFDAFRKEAGLNSFTMTPTKWISATNAKGVKVKRGHGGGTYAHVDIAFEFASWISPEFKLYIIKDYQRLKSDENSRLSLEWNEKRLFTKINYRIHTDAVKENLAPNIKGKGGKFVYATEADVLNVALFGRTAKQWRDENPDKPGNLRDGATLHQLIVLANLESMNAQLIKEGRSRQERAEYLNAMAREQLSALADNPTVKALEGGEAGGAA